MGKSNNPQAESAHEHVSAPLSTLKDPSSFGPPPKHRDWYGDAAGPPRPRPSQPQQQTGSRPPPPLPSGNKPSGNKPPSLPPRLPPRQNSHPDAYAPEPPPTYSESTQLNQGAINRLGQAGVSVPGLDIGRTASPPVPPRRTESPTTVSPAGRNPHLAGLQSRFANMSMPSSSSSSSSQPAAPPSKGTTWAEKQAAMRTASNLREDPSKVSLSDARSAASTANNFRERHGEQVASGWKAANSLNQKYGVAGRISGLASGSTSSTPPPASPTSGGLDKKKPPPPPPPKKRELGGSGAPPPIPLGSKPKF